MLHYVAGTVMRTCMEIKYPKLDRRIVVCRPGRNLMAQLNHTLN